MVLNLNRRILIHRFFLILFVGIVMIDPSNRLLHMKEISFGMLLFFTICLNQGKWYADSFMSYLLLLLLALLSICMGVVVFQTDIASCIPYLKSLVFVLVIFALSKLNTEEIIKINYKVGLGLSCFVSVLLLASVGGLFDLSNMVMTLADAGAVYIARREVLGYETLMFFYASMPFCFFSLIYALRHKKIIQVLIILAPIAYGGSRTPMLMALVLICYILYDRKSKWLRYILAGVFVISIIYLVKQLTSQSYSDDGDYIKFAVAKYLFTHSSLLGHGVGALYWDPARLELVASTEMTYLEMLYQYGWILTPVVLYVFFSPFFVLYKKRNDYLIRDFSVAYLLYLVNAGTNPLLINSTGLYVFACAITIVAKIKEEKKLSYIVNTPNSN